MNHTKNSGVFTSQQPRPKRKYKRRVVQSETISVVMKEQQKLAQAEKEIEKVLSSINEHINTLKVEELQLRANLVQKSDGAHSKAISQTSSEGTSYNMVKLNLDDADVINTQNINLDLKFLDEVDFD